MERKRSYLWDPSLYITYGVIKKKKLFVVYIRVIKPCLCGRPWEPFNGDKCGRVDWRILAKKSLVLLYLWVRPWDMLLWWPLTNNVDLEVLQWEWSMNKNVGNWCEGIAGVDNPLPYMTRGWCFGVQSSYQSYCNYFVTYSLVRSFINPFIHPSAFIHYHSHWMLAFCQFYLFAVIDRE